MHHADQHNKQHLWAQCGTVSLAAHLAAHHLSWLGHMLRMGEARYPHQVLFCPQPGSHTSWDKQQLRLTRDLKDPQVPTNMHDLQGA